MYSESIKKLINLFSKFPTVGPRTATRFVFYLLKIPKEEIRELTDSILMLREKIKPCKFCFNPFDPSFVPLVSGTTEGKDKGELCSICSNPIREKSLLCVVEKESDLESLEKTHKYQGLYFVLGGTVSNLKKEDLDKLRTDELKERIENPQKFGISETNIDEIIIATNSTAEGEATALYLERVLKPLAKKITRLGRGLPVGGEIEYADEETIAGALEGRKPR